MSLTPEEIELIKWLHESEPHLTLNGELMRMIIIKDKPEIREVKYEVSDNSSVLFLLGVMIFIAIVAIAVMG